MAERNSKYYIQLLLHHYSIFSRVFLFSKGYQCNVSFFRANESGLLFWGVMFGSLKSQNIHMQFYPKIYRN